MAVDPKVVPLWSVVIVDGHPFAAQDTGSAIRGRRLDVYFADHGHAKRFGRQLCEVVVFKPGEPGYERLRSRVGHAMLASRWARRFGSVSL
ncbi:MAG: 3D domain-containing protein [Patescibacteria group bacterium]